MMLLSEGATEEQLKSITNTSNTSPDILAMVRNKTEGI